MKYSFKPTYKDRYLAELALLMHDRLRLSIMTLMMILGLVLLTVILWAGATPTLYQSFLIVIAMTFFPLLAALSAWIAGRRTKFAQGQTHIELAEEGLRVTHPLYTVELRWTGLHKIRETRRYFLFFISPRTAYFLIKSKLGGDDEVQRVRDFIARHPVDRSA